MASLPDVATRLARAAGHEAVLTARRVRNGLRHLAQLDEPVLNASGRDTVWSSGKVQLWRFHNENRTVGTPVLLVHSLVSRSYVFDLTPGNSFVETMTRRGFDLFCIDWGVPDEYEADNTLETYCDELLPEIVRQVCRITASPDVNLFGYCFGGLLSLLYAAGHPDDPIRSLAVMATPIDLGHMQPVASLMRAGVDPGDLLDHTGNVPASTIRNSFRLLLPTGDVTSAVNFWQHLDDEAFVVAHRTMTGWAEDHIPFPGACARQVAHQFVRRNSLAAGHAVLGGRRVDLADIRVPFCNIVGEQDTIVPPRVTGRLSALVGSADKTELRLPAGHVGLIVGRTAHRRHIPAMADWLAAHSRPVGPGATEGRRVNGHAQPGPDQRDTLGSPSTA